MARTALGLGVRELGEMAKVNPNTITRIENGSDARQSTIATLQATLEASGIIFITENGEGPGVRLKKQQPST